MIKQLTMIGIIGIVGLVVLGISNPTPQIPIGDAIPKSEVIYFAEIDKNNKVINVIVANQEFINSGAVGNPSNWVQTYKDNSKRKNYAGIGYKYDQTSDAFITPKPNPDATLDVDKGQWVLPVIQKGTASST